MPEALFLSLDWEVLSRREFDIRARAILASAIVISPARMLNTILVFFSTGITGGLTHGETLRSGLN